MFLAESTGFTAVTTGVSNLMTVVGTVIQTITGEPILAALFAAGFVGIAIGIVRGLKSV